MITENVDRRILGAFVCRDAFTQESITAAMSAAATGWKLKPNRSGIYVIFDGPGFSKLTTEFLPGSDWPAAPTKFEVTVKDPRGVYLSRRVNLNAPQSVPTIPPAPAGSASNPAALAALSNTATVFAPQPIQMYPGPASPVGANWASLHVSVTRAGTAPPQGLRGAVVQVVRTSDATVLATGMAHSSGEALLAVLGPTTSTSHSGAGPVTVFTVAVKVTAYFDPANLNRPAGWIPNPDDILKNIANPALKSASQDLQISSGQQFLLNLTISV